MRIDRRFTEELLAKINIVDVVNGYCQLTKKGANYWACCPLPGHSERTPSFAVNEAGQFFKCFGCGRGGSVISFIMEMESLTFTEAVVFLCEKMHLPLPENTDRESEKRTRVKLENRDRLRRLMRDAALFYVGNLKDGRAQKHRDYLKKRGIPDRFVTIFGLGASTDYDSLVVYLEKKGYTREEMTASGAVQSKDGRFYDALGGRLIFPIIDAFGNVIAFGGRVLEKTDFAKYKNTGDTALFNKRKTLYNINTVKKLKGKTGRLEYVIMVEGYMDTISLGMAGYRNAVASMGTSLTVDQARLLKRYTDTALICYDGDSAGQNATVRGLEILKDNGLEVRVVSLPDGLDPDEVIKERGKEAYQRCLDEALPLTDFKLKKVRETSDRESISGKRRYIEESLTVIANCESIAMQEELLKKLRDESGLTYDSLKRDLERMTAGHAGAVVTAAPEVIAEFAGSSVELAERFVLCAVIRGEKYAADFCFEDYTDYGFADRFRGELFQFIMAKRLLGREIDPAKLKDFAGEENFSELMAVLSAIDLVKDSARPEYFKDCLLLLRRREINGRLEKLKNDFKAEKDRAKRDEIARQISVLAVESKKT